MPVPPFRPFFRSAKSPIGRWSGVATVCAIGIWGTLAGCRSDSDAEREAAITRPARSEAAVSRAAIINAARTLYGAISQVKVAPSAGSASPAMQMTFETAPPSPTLSQLTASAPHNAGIVVFEPVAGEGVAASDADFAAGCGNQLEFAVGGQPELGQTPLLMSVNRVRRERKLPDLRLSAAAALAVGKAAGATIVAVGTAAPGKEGSGGAGTLALTYHLIEVVTGQPVGTPITIQGTPAQIVAALPGLGMQIARLAGVAKPQIALSPAATPEEIAAETRVIRREHPAASDVKLVTDAASQDPVALLYVLGVDGSKSATQLADDAALLLTKRAPDNPLAWGYVAKISPASVAPLASPLATLRKTYPNSYGLAHAAVWTARIAGTPGAELTAAEAVVRNAPHNPDAWLSLGSTLGDMGQALRRCRRADAITEDEWNTLHKIYAQWEDCIQRAVAIDPIHDAAWQRLSVAATFAGDRSVADDAYGKAETVSADKAEVYSWGLQMFQGKWGGSPSDLSSVADHASRDDYPRVEQTGSVVADLKEAGFADQATALANRVMATLDARIKKDPDDADAHWQKASLLWHQNDMVAAEREYKAVTALRPDNVAAHIDYASTLDKRGMQQQAIGEYETVLKLDPRNIDAPVNLGIDLKHLGQTVEAEKWLRLGLQRYPNSMEGHYGLGELYGKEKNYAGAAEEYHRALLLDGNAPIVYANLVWSLSELKKYNEAIHWGEEGVGLYSMSEDKATGEEREAISLLHAALAYAYLKSHKDSDAETQNDAAIALNPANISAAVNQGYVYNDLHQRGKARQQWEAAAKMNLSASDAEEVRHDLVVNPDNGT